MELPFYYSFKDFEENYNSDLQNFLIDFPDATELDFLKDLKEKYADFVSWSGKYHFKGYKIKSHSGVLMQTQPKWITGSKYHDILSGKIERHLVNSGINYIEANTNYLHYYWICAYLETEIPYTFYDNIHEIMKVFFFYEENSRLFLLNVKKMKNFEFSVIKIAEKIAEKSKEIYRNKKNDFQKNKEQDQLKIAVDLTETKPKVFSAPERIALLQTTGLEEHIDRLTGNTAEQKYRLLSVLFGLSYETVKKCYVNSTVKILHTKRAKDFYDNDFRE